MNNDDHLHYNIFLKFLRFCIQFKLFLKKFSLKLNFLCRYLFGNLYGFQDNINENTCKKTNKMCLFFLIISW